MKDAELLRCKIDGKYVCAERAFFDPQSQTNISPCLYCDIFAKARQSIFTNDGGGILLSLEDTLQGKVKDLPEYINVTELPDTIKAVLADYKFKTDARGNEALFLYLRTKQNKMIVQKFTSTAYDEILTAIKDAGGSELLKVTMVEWEKKMIGRMQKPRLAPKPKTKKEG